MTLSLIPGNTGAPGFVCNIVDNGVQCYDAKSHKEVTIAIEDIVCILPDSGQERDKYTMLFLQENPETSSPKAQGSCACLANIQILSPPPILLSQHLCAEIPGHLSPQTGQNIDIHVIISTLSGTGMSKIVFQNILQPFLSYFGLVDYEVHETQSTQTIIELCQSKLIPRAQAGTPQTIILLSGDGGLTDIIDTFYNTSGTTFVPPSIALLPTGTGNAMASSIGLLSRQTASLKTLLRGGPEPIPIFVAKFSPGAQYIAGEGHTRVPIGDTVVDSQYRKVYFAIVASWGIHAALVADSDTTEYRRFGADRFKMAAQELLFPSSGVETHRYAGTVTITKPSRQGEDGHVETIESEEHMYVLTTLVPRLEKDFVISPESVSLDGRLRIVHFPPVPPDQAMQLMTYAYQEGRHVHEREVFYAEIESLRIDFHESDERWRRACIDGKIVAVEEGGWMEVHKEPRHLLNIIIARII